MIRLIPGLVGYCCLLFACGGGGAETSAVGEEELPVQKLPAFTEVTAASGLDFSHTSGAYGEFFMPEIMSGGAAFLDYNQDGAPDILLAGGGNWQQPGSVASLRLYKNDGKGNFTDVSTAVGLGAIAAYVFGFTIGDYDRDGDVDIYATTLEENLLLEYENGRFTDVATRAGVAGKAVWSTAALFVDVDLDGWLDLYVGNYVKWSKEIDRNLFCSLDGKNDNYCHPDLYEGEQGVFYRNQGNGTFAARTQVQGLADRNGTAPMKTLGVVSMDANGDGWPDLVLANDMQADLLFINRGDGTFREAGPGAGIAYNRQGKARAGMGIVTGYLDGGDFPSIAVGNFSRQPISLFTATPAGVFIDRAYASRIGKPSFLTLTFGLSLFDADLDGDLDLFAANGHVFTDINKKVESIHFRQPPHFFLNDGSGAFADIATTLGGTFTDSLVARASAHADVDGDGDLDLLVTENNGPVHLLRNDAGGHYLRVALTGERGNPNAVDAELTLLTDQNRRLIRRVKSSDSYLAQSEFPVTFGLQVTEKPLELTIKWPVAGGHITKHQDLQPDGRYRISEGGVVEQITIR